MKHLFFIALVALAVVALTGRIGTRRQYLALATLSFVAALASFGNYGATYLRGYRAEPLQVVALQICFLVLGGIALGIAVRRKP